MMRTSKPTPTKAPTSMMKAPGGSGNPMPNMSLQYPQSPGGGGFLSSPNSFSDARPPSARGAKKSAGYPNFQSNP